MLSGCQNNTVNELENEALNKEQEIKELTIKVTELTEIIAKVKKENEIIEKENEDLKYNLAEYNQSKHPIELDFEKEMALWSGNTSEVVEIIIRHGDRWKVEMENHYELIYKELDEDKKKYLISSQQKWEEYIKENEELDLQILDQEYHGGSIMRILSADLYYNQYSDRALDLIEKHFILK